MRIKGFFLPTSLGLFCSLLLMLTGCQNAIKNHCEQTNWRQQAYMDALTGKPLTDFQKIQKRCTSQQIEIPYEIYKEGYESGLVKLCTPQAAYDFGLNGKEYFGICKDLEEDKFLKSYRLGRLQYLLHTQERLQKDLQESEGRVWRKQNEYDLESNSNPIAAREVYDVLESYRAELYQLQQENNKIKKRIAEIQALLEN